MVLANAVRWTCGGAAIGIAGSLFAERALGSMLFGIPPHDPATLACAVAILGTVAAIAAWLPARQASAVDPMAALRSE
jgi:ABC-type antimicrobial peptide transport system permease subunit